MYGALRMGVDVGSTTIKLVVLDQKYNIIFKQYARHYSDIRKTVNCLFTTAQTVLQSKFVSIVVTGSSGIGLANYLQLPFIQEVIACTQAVKHIIPHTDTVIELGGEDAKIIYFGSSVEQRMNSACAGGTGAFIDQMAAFLHTDAAGLNELAKDYKNIYAIASRCGVFAKTDVQALLNEGAASADIAASILQAIVNQTISSLAQSRPISGKVAFLGGPLHFMPELRRRFAETLNLPKEQIIIPAAAHYFAAIGAALAEQSELITYECLQSKIAGLVTFANTGAEKLAPLFATLEEYKEFSERHRKNTVLRRNLTDYQGKAYLGIDAGSTTTKLALISADGGLLYSHYAANKGMPLDSVIVALKSLYRALPGNVVMAGSAVTGYGERLIQEALGVDIGEVETVAHFTAASQFAPGVDFVLDIGGQDMKSFFVRNGVIDTIMLNEACSAGCGSFIENFAQSLGINVQAFADLGIKAEAPVDLGSRCTVFMNSKVRQVQKEGASVNDIAAGLAISTIKNALFKVIRVKNFANLGQKIVVQGGAFYNDALLRALEKILDREVIRPDIAGLMGAYGAALIARQRCNNTAKSTLLNREELAGFTAQTASRHCSICGNNCLITQMKFSTGRVFYAGNRCTKGAGQAKKIDDIPNMFAYKYQRLFQYVPLSEAAAHRGLIGMPRVLNMYDDYPFWVTFFTELGYRVVLSSHSSRQLYETGMETIPSESVCYPAKLAHGHIKELISKGVKKIFYPCIPRNIKEASAADNCYNCPVVAAYPEIIHANMDMIQTQNIVFYHPYLPLDNPGRMLKRLLQELAPEKLSKTEVRRALHKAYAELERYRTDVRCKGEEILAYLNAKGLRGIVLAGRPYHVDPEINHGIPEMLQAYGLAVLSEDAVSQGVPVVRPLRVVDQWTYPARLYGAAALVAQQPNLELIQLNSFGCGLDAIIADQVQEILAAHHKIHTVIKLDEMHNLGTTRIRLRSLFAAIQERPATPVSEQVSYRYQRTVFRADMKKHHTILVPQVSPIHFQFLATTLEKFGYRGVVTPLADKAAIELGLRYVHNDVCYPAVIVIGQILQALQSGAYDLNNTSVIMTQTGGCCRATNYMALLRKALKDAAIPQVPVISLSAGLEENPGFDFSPAMLGDALMGLLYGDLLMRVLHQVRPYEKIPGSANRLYDHWVNKCQQALQRGDKLTFVQNIFALIRDFDGLAIHEDIVKPKVGIVGEIFVKYHPAANNQLIDFLERAGVEIIVPDLTDFFLYCAYDSTICYELLSGTWSSMMKGKLFIELVELYRWSLRKALMASRRFSPPSSIQATARLAARHISLANQSGEGWLLTGKMVELIRRGITNILCLQPFACLPNHISGKGMLKELRRCYPGVNIMPLDFDPGASEVNIVNRIKLLLSVAQ